MKCEKCGEESKVINSRKTSKAREYDIPLDYLSYKNLTYRSLECKHCFHRFKSIEITAKAFEDLYKSTRERVVSDILKVLS